VRVVSPEMSLQITRNEMMFLDYVASIPDAAVQSARKEWHRYDLYIDLTHDSNVVRAP
jgi:hypothetical protein